MKKLLLIPFGILSYGTAISQSLAPEVNATSGDHFTGTNAQISWTIGEPIIETYSTANNQLTQGFHQTNLIINSIDNIESDYSISVFPNPASNSINVEVSNNDDELYIEFFDINGKLLQHKSFKSNTDIDVSTYPNSTYFLHIKSQNDQLIKSFKIQKIH